MADNKTTVAVVRAVCGFMVGMGLAGLEVNLTPIRGGGFIVALLALSIMLTPFACAILAMPYIPPTDDE